MPRLIDADKLYDKVEAYYKSIGGQSHVIARKVLDEICDAPTIDAKPVVHARVQLIPGDGKFRDTYVCSACNRYVEGAYTEFCSHCGAKLDLL